MGWAIVIGVGLISGIAVRSTLILFLSQMLGTLSAPLMKPSLFFSHKDVFLLTTEGEFVVKNIVLITAGLVIAGYGLQPIGKNGFRKHGWVRNLVAML